MTLLSIRNLNIHFKTEAGVFHAVKNFNLEINAGETVAIVGESGSGKSVSTKAIMGLLDERSLAKRSGEALYYREGNATDLLALNGNQWQEIRGSEIAMIFQEPMSALNPVMTCGKQVMEAVMLHRRLKGSQAKQEVLRLFDEVQVKDTGRIFSSYPHQVSGGQRQRVMIAMALAGNPSLLIADEPTTALDVSVQAAIMQLLKRIQQERNMALLFISHDLEVVRKTASRILVMFRGEVLEEAETTRLFSSPAHIYTKALIQCKPSLDETVGYLPVMQDFFTLGPGGEFLEKNFQPPHTVHVPTIKDETLLVIRNLQVSYHQKNGWGLNTGINKVLYGLDFNIYKGETLGILGESGSGKSTLGRAIMQLLKYSGEISWKGETLAPGSRGGRKILARKIQMIYQDPYSSLNPRLRVGDALEEVMMVHGLGKNTKERQEKIALLLAKVGLPADTASKYPHEFSGGQRQRVSIARALAVEPEFIVCDESVSALDVSVQAQVLNLLKEIQYDFGLTYLFITHDLGVAKYIADRILILDKGKIAELKNTADIFRNPENEYTRALFRAYELNP